MANGKRARVRAASWLAAMLAACALFAGCLVSFIALGASASESYSAVLANGSVQTLEESYARGEVFALPENAAISDSTGIYEASVILRDPDGNGLTASESVLNVAGVWTLEYRAYNENGALLSAKQKFSCLDPLYEVSSAKSFASYAESYEFSEMVSGYTGSGTGAGGIAVSVSKGDTFTLNQEIDLSDATAAETFLSFYLTPLEMYSYDAAKFKFTLTDPYDSSNYVTLTVQQATQTEDRYTYRYSYVTVNAANQSATGLERGSSSTWTTITYRGESYVLHVDNGWGTPIYNSMYGGYPEGDSTTRDLLGTQISFSYDASEKAFYVQSSGKESTSSLMIADLDDATLFGDDLWSGFTNGTAILSVEMSGYKALSGNLVITDVAGSDLSGSFASDKSGPVVTVDLGDYSANALPEARVGDAYPLFAAEAADSTDGEVPVYASVWYNYSSETTRTRVTVTDGAFTPAKEGVYTIVYSAEDRSGNATDVAYSVTASRLGELSVSYAKSSETAAAGEAFVLENTELSGVSGNGVLKISASLDSDSSVYYEFTENGGNYSFVPLYAGVYTVTITYSDYLQEKEETFSLTVNSAAGAYIPGDAVVPRYAISGAKYELPSLTGYTFENGVQVKACSVAIEGGTNNNDGTFTVTAESGFVTLTYSLEMAGGDTAVKTYNVPVIAGTGLSATAGTLNMMAFFTESVAPEQPSGGVKGTVSIGYDDESLASYDRRLLVSVENTDADAMAYGAVDFINKVLASSFSTSFSVYSSNFLRLAIYLTDSADSSQTVKLVYRNTGSWAMAFSVNGGAEYSTSLRGSATATLTYNAASRSFTTGGITASVATYLDGKAFGGFTSGYVYVTYQLEGVYVQGTASGSTGAIRIIGINNQTFSATASDNIMPQATAYVSKGDLSVNTVTEIPAFYAADVLDPYVTLTVTVTDPSGNYVASADGVLLDGTQDLSRSYEILLSEYGSYTVTVVGTPGTTSMSLTATYGIKVLDMTPPAVTFGEAVTEAKIGDVVPFAPVTVTDDYSSAEDIAITYYLMTPSGQIAEVDVDTYGYFTASEAGVYYFIVLACDEGNVYGSTQVANTAIVWYTIAVTE